MNIYTIYRCTSYYNFKILVRKVCFPSDINFLVVLTLMPIGSVPNLACGSLNRKKMKEPADNVQIGEEKRQREKNAPEKRK